MALRFKLLRARQPWILIITAFNNNNSVALSVYSRCRPHTWAGILAPSLLNSVTLGKPLALSGPVPVL